MQWVGCRHLQVAEAAIGHHERLNGRSIHVRGSTIPIAIALRDQFAGSYYRDLFVRALKEWDIDCA
jgi:hypothetical protein